MGEDYPISIACRLTRLSGGYTADDMQKVVPEFVKYGCDIIMLPLELMVVQPG